MNPRFETEQDVDREYNRLIEAEADPLRRSELQVEHSKRKMELVRAQNNQQLIDNWKELATYKFPESATFPQLVTGTTEAEIMASAEAAHNQVLQLKRGGSGQDPFADAREQARNFYGGGPTTGGQSPTPTGYVPPDQGKIRQELAFAQKFNDAPRDAYGQRLGISPQEVTQYTNSRFFDHVRNALGYWGAMTNSSYAARRRG